MNKFKTAGEKLNKGAAFLADGKVNQAITAFKLAIKIDPKLVAAHFDLALAYQQKGDVPKIIASLKNSINLNPNDFEALNLLGHYYSSQNKLDLAIPCFEKAVKVNPLLAEGYYNLGVALMQKGKGDEAIENYKKSMKIFPDNSIVLNNIGVTYEKMGRPQEALRYFQKSLKLNPKNTNALSNIGAYWVGINPRKAAGFFKKALEINPNMDNAAFNLAVCLRLVGQTEDAIKLFEKALELNPNYSVTYGQLYHQLRKVCNWDKAEKLFTKMKKLTNIDIMKGEVPAETGFVQVVYNNDPKRDLKVATAWSKHIQEKVVPYKKNYDFKNRHHKKIRIGYLSNDFKDHATSHLMLGLFRLHNQEKFEIYAYSYGENDRSFYRNEIEKLTKFQDITTLSFPQAADLIYKDKLDILVDLKGHTTNSRLEISALRPAPIQVNYLGFPGTSGAKFFDYFITDNVTTPKELAPYFSEKLIFMPNSYQINDSKQKIAKNITSRYKLMLPEDKFLFCSFNQPYKIGPQLFNSWMRILKAVPGSALCLLAKTNNQMESLRKEAVKREVDPNRLIFSIPLPKPSHLARLSLCDLALDTFPCNGHTTTSDCLWAGLPVVTTLGKHFASRVSASLLTAIGLPQLITKTQKGYENLAIELATSPKRLNTLRLALNSNRLKYPLFDTEKSTKNLETAYSKIWENYTKGGKPKNINV